MMVHCGPLVNTNISIGQGSKILDSVPVRCAGLK